MLINSAFLPWPEWCLDRHPCCRIPDIDPLCSYAYTLFLPSGKTELFYLTLRKQRCEIPSSVKRENKARVHSRPLSLPTSGFIFPFLKSMNFAAVYLNFIQMSHLLNKTNRLYFSSVRNMLWFYFYQLCRIRIYTVFLHSRLSTNCTILFMALSNNTV